MSPFYCPMSISIVLLYIIYKIHWNALSPEVQSFVSFMLLNRKLYGDLQSLKKYSTAINFVYKKIIILGLLQLPRPCQSNTKEIGEKMQPTMGYILFEIFYLHKQDREYKNTWERFVPKSSKLCLFCALKQKTVKLLVVSNH